MSRAKTRRPVTRSRAESVVTDSFERAPRKLKRGVSQIPEDLPSAAEAALDDLLASAENGVSFDEREVTSPAPRRLPPPAPGAKPRPPVSEPPPRTRGPVPEAPRRVATAAPLDDEQLVEETVLPELPQLELGIYEDGAHLADAQNAIEAAGHMVAIAVGREGAAQIAEVIREGTLDGELDAVLVALPGGEAIIDAALALAPRRPVVIASLAGDPASAIRRAIAAGADLATTRPHDVDKLAPVLLAAARLASERNSTLSVRGSEQVLRARLEAIADAEQRSLQPFEMFQRVLELEIKRARRFEYPLSVALFAVEVAPPPPPAGIRGILRARAGTAIIHTIRDIDLATQLDHERFLVLLPYTDLTGATNLARRVIAAVATGDPVVSAGRSFPPRVVGAVAGARPGEPLSFAKLMKDTQRALDQARRDGAELAVQP